MKFFFILLVGIILIGGAVGGFYYFYEKPQSEEPPLHNLSISFKDSEGDFLKIPYVVVLDGSSQPYKNGNSSTRASVLERVPVGSSIAVHSDTSKDYYTSSERISGSAYNTSQNLRFDLKMTEVGGITNVSHRGQFGERNPIPLDIEGEAEVREIGVCIGWSTKLITVEVRGKSKMDIPDRLRSRVNNCYRTGDSIVEGNSSHTYFLEYSSFGSVDSKDYIEVYVLDADKPYWSSENVYQDKNGGDIGLEDETYEIRG